MKEIIAILCLVFVLSVFIATKAEEILTVDTTYGALQGKWMISRSGRVFIAFLGIPYAAPPAGPLRFMPPKPPQKWNGIRNATEEGNVCLQRVIGGNEDCLYLNVFTHCTNNSNGSAAVMVYIHGGGFYGGSSAVDMYGSEYIMDRNVVLVTLQYRLGVLGFLSTEDSVIPGNMGLKDQLRALQWVQENIKAFGGDPLKVTIFGNSAGSTSVHLHMLSPASRDLFARAISQSGTALSAFSIIGKGTSRNITHWLAQNLNCSTKSSEEILQCLQNMDSADIQQEYSNLQDTMYDIKKVLFRPVVEEQSEHAFLTSSPLSTTTDKPWLVGLNANEGLFKINLQFLNETISLIHSEFHQYGPAILFFDDTCSKPDQIAELIYNFYFKNASTKNEIITSLEQIISDSWFIWPTLQAVHQHNGALYCYLFEHHGEHSFTQVRGGPPGFGVSHMDELHYLFPQRKIFPVVMNEGDTNISKLMVNLWVNFAEETNPTPYSISSNPQKEESAGIVWELSNNTDPKFLHVETNKLSMVKDIFSDRMDFWKWLPIRDKLV